MIKSRVGVGTLAFGIWLLSLGGSFLGASEARAGWIVAPGFTAQCCDNAKCQQLSALGWTCGALTEYIDTVNQNISPTGRWVVSASSCYLENPNAPTPDPQYIVCQVSIDGWTWDGQGPVIGSYDSVEDILDDAILPNGVPFNGPCAPSGSCGNPVNLSNGVMWHQFTDFKVAGSTAESNIELVRTYTTRPATSASPSFGPKWFSSFDTRITKFPRAPIVQAQLISLVGQNKKGKEQLSNGSTLDFGSVPPLDYARPTYSGGYMFAPDAVWIDEHGRPWRFFRQGNGTLTSAAGASFVLSEHSDHYEIQKKDGTKLYFFGVGNTLGPEGRLWKIVDRHSNETTFTYTNGKLSQISEALVGTITINRNGLGLISSIVRDRDSLTYTYTYDGNGKLISSTDPGNKVTEYTYNSGQVGSVANGLLSAIEDPVGRLLTFTYDNDGKSISQTEPGNGTRGFSYSNSPFQTTVTEVDGRQTVYQFNTNHELIKTIHPDLSESEQVWTSGRVTKTIDELDYETVYGYDLKGNVTSLKLPADSTPLTMTFHQTYGVPTQITPRVGSPINFTVNTWNGDISNIAQTDSTGTINLAMQYDGQGKVNWIDNGLSGGYQLYTDGYGRYTSVYDQNSPQTLAYDANGHLYTRNFASGRVLTYSYNYRDQVTQIQDSAGPTLNFTYDDVGRMLTRVVTDFVPTPAVVQTTTYAWDARDRLTSVTDAEGRTTTYEYDFTSLGIAVGDVPSKITDPAGRHTLFEYDSRWRLKKVTDPKTGDTQYAYNLRGDLTSLTDPNGNVTTFAYDGNRRMTSRTRASVKTTTAGVSSAVNEVTNFTYDAEGRLKREERMSAVSGGPVQVTLYDYDLLGRKTRRRQRIEQPLNTVISTQDDSNYTYERILDAEVLKTANNGSVHLTFTKSLLPPYNISSYQVAAASGTNPLGLIQDTYNVFWDNKGEVSQIQDGNYNNLYYATHDSAGRLTSANAMNWALTAAITYDGFGRKDTVTHNTGLTGSYDYDLLNRPTAITWNGADGSGPTLINFSETITYDPLKDIINRIDRETALGYFTYTHNAMDELTGVAYTATGTPAVALGNKVNRTVGYDLAGNRLTDSLLTGNATIIANALISDSGYNYWQDVNGLGRLTQKRSTTSTTAEALTYRADGLVSSYLRFTDTNANGTQDTGEARQIRGDYYYDALDRRVAKKITPATGSVYYQRYNYFLDQPKILQSKSGSGAVAVHLDGLGIDEHLGRVTSTGTALSYATDHLGSVTNGTAAGGKGTFGAFGELLGSAPTISSTTEPVVYGLAGYMLDGESAWYVTKGARFLDPNIGRWNMKDPIGFDGGDSNLYRYVENNALFYFDPMGWLKYKKGVNPASIRPPLSGKTTEIDQVFMKHGLPEPVCTSGNDSRHKQGSRHYSGNAIDLRGNHVSDEKMKQLAKELKERFGPDYDVVPEFFPKDPANDHIHIEFDPKGRK